jgi:beta-glucosidase
MAAATADLFGTWTLDGVPDEVLSLADAVTEQLTPAWAIDHIAWHDSSSTAQAVQVADALIAVLGETPSRSGEANSVADPGLPPGQTAWLEQMLGLGIPCPVYSIFSK